MKWKRILLCLVIFGFAAGCSGSGSEINNQPIQDESPENESPEEGTPEEGTPEEVESTGFLALATDPDGDPVAGAVVAGSGISSKSGVALGEAVPEAGEWVEIRAQGYAPDYVQRQGVFSEYAILESVLSPLTAKAVHNAGSSTTVKSAATDPEVELHLGSDLFTSDTVFVEVAVIDPLNLGPAFAPNNAGENLYPQIAFSIEATDPAGNDAVFASGKTASLILRDDGALGDPPRMAVFSPQSGLWEMEEGACSRLDDLRIRCELEHFSTRGGMTGDPPDSGAGYSGARARYREALRRWSGEGGGSPVPDYVHEALEALAQAALDFAAGNRNEVGKQRLLGVAANAQLIGREDLAEDMITETKTITEEIANELLANPDCDRLAEMKQAFVQCQQLGLFDLSEDLMAEIRELADVCNEWVGKVNYTISMETLDPHREGYTYHSGAITWSEWHEVTLSIDPRSLAIQGYDASGLVAPEVAYRETIDSDCGEAYAERKNWGSGNTIFLTMSGSYDRSGDRPHFTLDPPQKQSGNIAVSFTDYILAYTFNDTSDCILEEWGPNTVSSVPDYQSLLGAGFSGTPPMTLAQMLNEGNYSNYPQFEEIKGQKELALDIPAVGVYPFTKATVTWHFTHENSEPLLKTPQ